MIEEQDENEFVLAATAKLELIYIPCTNMVARENIYKILLMLYLKAATAKFAVIYTPCTNMVVARENIYKNCIDAIPENLNSKLKARNSTHSLCGDGNKVSFKKKVLLPVSIVKCRICML